VNFIISLELEDETKPDISNFAYSLLKPLFSTDILDRITEYIIECAQGVFLWVQLVRDELQEYVEAGQSQRDIFEFIRSLPKELEEFYRRIRDKLESNERDVSNGIKIFRFVLFASREAVFMPKALTGNKGLSCCSRTP
jgi:ankyrin repeat domain-containing protein 50